MIKSEGKYVNIYLGYIANTISVAGVHIRSQNQMFYRRIIGLAGLIKWRLEPLKIVGEGRCLYLHGMSSKLSKLIKCVPRQILK